MSGTIHIFTEIEFLLFENKRVDGLIVVVRGNKIVDAVLIEVKNKFVNAWVNLKLIFEDLKYKNKTKQIQLINKNKLIFDCHNIN